MKLSIFIIIANYIFQDKFNDAYVTTFFINIGRTNGNHQTIEIGQLSYGNIFTVFSNLAFFIYFLFPNEIYVKIINA